MTTAATHKSPTRPVMIDGDVAVCAATSIALTPSDGQPPEWVQLMPVGDIAANDGREPWRVTDAQALVTRSVALAAGGILPIDYDHAMDLATPRGEPAPASGWIIRLEVRPDGIWGQVDWTEDGARAVASRQYRFISPAFLYSKDRQVTRLLGAGLVNRPALPQLAQLAHSTITNQGIAMDPILKAVLDALGLPPDADQTAVLAAIAARPGAATELKALASAVGQPETASETDIIAAIKTLRASAAAAPLLETQVATLSARLAKLEEADLADAVDGVIAQGKFAPAQRDELLALAQADRGAFDRLAAKAVAVLQPGATLGAGPAAADGGLSAEEKAVCASMGLSEEVFLKAKGEAK